MTTLTAFAGGARIAHGSACEVALALSALAPDAPPPLVLDDATGKAADLDLRGGPEAIRRRYPAPQAPEPKPGRGRPKLGVVPREVPLLPRHWEWLARQPGGASAALRRLVEAARREGGSAEDLRVRRERAYSAMAALAGDAPGFEEASRALFAGDRPRLEAQIATWPGDIQAYVLARLDDSAPLD